LGDISAAAERERVADLLAYLIAKDAVVGIYQGAAETGPRALGHRSILANPTNESTRRILNERVKFRELIRPLAPMATPEAARLWFELSPRGERRRLQRVQLHGPHVQCEAGSAREDPGRNPLRRHEPSADRARAGGSVHLRVPEGDGAASRSG